jgi:hypothetical protein
MGLHGGQRRIGSLTAHSGAGHQSDFMTSLCLLAGQIAQMPERSALGSPEQVDDAERCHQ